MAGTSNRNLNAARITQNDEFYTRMEDIEREMVNYRRHFRGKVVYCNCDDPTVSNFYRYFKEHFSDLGLKRLVTTCYRNDQPTLFSHHDCEQGSGIIFEGGGSPILHTARRRRLPIGGMH